MLLRVGAHLSLRNLLYWLEPPKVGSLPLNLAIHSPTFVRAIILKENLDVLSLHKNISQPSIV